MTTITRLSAADFAEAVPDLADLLVDAVAYGASLGFLAPLRRDAAVSWWRDQASRVADGSLLVWVVRTPERLAGTIGLALEGKPNGRHRADVIKLMVHSGSRGRGLSRRLLGAAEEAARATGRHLLLLDTETDSAAEHVYRTDGWLRYGIVPGYATSPAGEPKDCSFYYKRLD
jgi:GNAT superfamily N-acetyltransferase